MGHITNSYDALNNYNLATEFWFYIYPRGGYTFYGDFIIIHI